MARKLTNSSPNASSCPVSHTPMLPLDLVDGMTSELLVDEIGVLTAGTSICPGRFLADNSVFIAIASILKVFDITLARDSNGSEIPVPAVFTSGFMSCVLRLFRLTLRSFKILYYCRHPESFQCQIKPRSASAKRLLLEQTDE
jgi:hypothetical protein